MALSTKKLSAYDEAAVLQLSDIFEAVTDPATNAQSKKATFQTLVNLLNESGVLDGGGGAGTYEVIGMPCSDETSSLQVDTNVFRVRASADMTVTSVYVAQSTACVGNNVIDVNLDGSSIVSDGLTIASGTDVTSGVLAVAVTKGQLFSVDIVSLGGTTGVGLKVFVIGDRT